MYQKQFRTLTFNIVCPDQLCFRRPADNRPIACFDWDDTLYHKPTGKVNKPMLFKLINYKQNGYYIELNTARGRKRSGNAWNKTVQHIVMQEIAEEVLNLGLGHLFDSITIGSKGYYEVMYDDKAVNVSTEWINNG